MNSARRRICAVTGSRADYGLLRPLLRLIAADPGCELRVIATGMHLAPQFGHTVAAIHADGFSPVEVECLLTSETRLSAAKSTGLATMGLAQVFADISPDLVVVLGDRFEILAAAQAAMLLGLPLAHIHGGEVTEGAMDESIRHAITKMAHLHFVAAAEYGRRVIQMGEDPRRVFQVGAPGLDNLAEAAKTDRSALESRLGLTLTDPVIVVTYHPVTLRQGDEITAVNEMLAALEDFPEAQVVVTGVNADPGHDAIARRLSEWVAAHAGRASLHASLGSAYLPLLGIAAVMVGNSSSGLIEAPAIHLPTVNIGDRQKGRLRAASVIDCAESRDTITAAIAKALSPEFRQSFVGMPPPYGFGGGVADRILAVLRDFDLGLLRCKPFHDLAGGTS
ncbi:UDP-N-acetyl-D-glucosamine 2-epimerase, UDP-hydrolysing [Magnetospirillum sp. ME-1]|uniref:UDP-N-acetylglucosamine 2-epimerase n=1 Tax=Magnetospirillum sp. ME-1 TaxID=1639348 RepID=UPI000A17DFF6|nr:UDP-N-acetylglucosamine 2-epimerase [Magnetospirillum sp. ME-1]ARJ66543.1 UDP-N-acetyl-D-glucosamine 2-epimerase, UDP-hydrolysing [Magnetospirillum sp. ME-1]